MGHFNVSQQVSWSPLQKDVGTFLFFVEQKYTSLDPGTSAGISSSLPQRHEPKSFRFTLGGPARPRGLRSQACVWACVLSLLFVQQKHKRRGGRSKWTRQKPREGLAASEDSQWTMHMADRTVVRHVGTGFGRQCFALGTRWVNGCSNGSLLLIEHIINGITPMKE